MKMKFALHLFVSAISLQSICTAQQSKLATWNLAKIPTLEEVGATVLPIEISPVKAPFQTIRFEKPKFPVKSIVLSLSKDSLNTTKIQGEIDNLSSMGGGIIILPKGNWFTGRIQLKDNVNFHLEDGAILSFSGEIKDFLPAVFTRIEGVEVMSLGACIYANGAKNIAITGKGRLIGPANGSIRSQNFAAPGLIDDIFDPKAPVEERIADGIHKSWILPPMFISPINCEGVYIEGVSLENTAFWNIVPIYCNNVIIRGVTVNSVGIPRGDGIDIESSKNVLIEYSTLSCGDDCFTIKSGRGPDGIHINKPTENVVVRYCLAKEGHGGITCGSETAGMIRNLFVHDCVFTNSGVGIRFKTRRSRGGGGENLSYERIRLNIKQSAFEWDMLGSANYVGDLANRLPARPVNELTPRYENIHAKDILIENSTYFVKVVGIPESPVKNLTIENMEVNCKQFFNAQDLRNSIFRNITISGKDSVLTLVDSKNILFDNIKFPLSQKTIRLSMKGYQSDSIIVKSAVNMQDTVWISKLNH